MDMSGARRLTSPDLQGVWSKEALIPLNLFTESDPAVILLCRFLIGEKLQHELGPGENWSLNHLVQK